SALLLGIENGLESFEVLAPVAFRGETECHRLEALPDLIQVGEIGRGELPDNGPGARTQFDETFPVEQLQRVAHRHPTHTELGGQIPFGQLAARWAGAVEDRVAQPGGDSARFQFAFICSGHRIIFPSRPGGTGQAFFASAFSTGARSAGAFSTHRMPSASVGTISVPILRASRSSSRSSGPISVRPPARATRIAASILGCMDPSAKVIAATASADAVWMSR